MKKNILYISVMLLTVLCACTAKENNEKSIMSPTPKMTATVTPVNTPTPVLSGEDAITPVVTVTAVPTEDPMQTTVHVKDEENSEKYEKLDWTKLDCYADLETSLRNSNLSNEGYLTYDEEGNIYFVDMNIGGIFTCERDGKNRRQLSSKNASALQIEGDWLYFVSGGVERIHIFTGEEQVIYDTACGEAVIKDSRIYVNSPEGFISMDLDGSNKTILCDQSLTLASYAVAENMWLGTAYEGENAEYFVKGHLYAYDEANDKMMHIMDGCWFPLLAGNWLSTFGSLTGTRYVWNLETDEMFDLNVYAQKAVSNGENLYYVRSNSGLIIVYQWNGGEAEEIWRLQDANLCNYIYLTPDMLYILPRVSSGGKSVNQLWYYDLETGETGQVY